MRNIKNYLSVFLVALLCVSIPMSATVVEAKVNLNDITVGDVVELENPIKSDVMVRGATTIMDNEPVACVVASGSPLSLNIINLNTGKVVYQELIPDASMAIWMMVKDSNGVIYFGGYGAPVKLYRFDPALKKVENLGLIPFDTTALISICIDKKNDVYLGAFPTGKIIKYSVKSKEFTDLGKQTSESQYLDALSCSGYNLFFGEFGSDVFKLDLRTGKKENITPSSVPIKILRTFTTQVHNNICVVLSHVVYKEKDQCVLMFYDIDAKKWLDIIIEDVMERHISPEKDGKFYFKKTDDGWYSFDFETFKSEYIFKGDTGSTVRGDGWVELSDPDFPGLNYVNPQYNGRIHIVNFETKKAKRYENMIIGASMEIENLEFGPDGRLYLGAFMGTKGAAINLQTGENEFFHMAQPEGIGIVGDRLIFGNYTGAMIYDMDPFKPFDYPRNKSKGDDENPKVPGSIGEKQDRPQVVKEAEGKAIIGTVPYYGELGGALAIYDPKTGKIDAYRNLVKDQSIIGLAYKDGVIYGSTAVWGGLNSYPTKTKAEIFKFDFKKREIITSVVPNIKSLSNPANWIGDLKFGPDGLLWTNTSGLLFALDPNTLEVVKELKLNEVQNLNRTTAKSIYFTSDGLLLISDNNKLKIVDQSTLKYLDTDKKCSTKFITDKYSNIYSKSESHLTRILISYIKEQEPILPKYEILPPKQASIEDVLKGKIVLMVNNANAYYNYQTLKIDISNDLVTPKIINDRTIIPVRFLGELLGSEVLWDNDTRTAVLKLNEKEIKITLDSDTILINGVEKKIDTAAQIFEGRTLLPLRVVAESFGKSILWDEKGLIVISDDDGFTMNKGQVEETINLLK